MTAAENRRAVPGGSGSRAGVGPHHLSDRAQCLAFLGHFLGRLHLRLGLQFFGHRIHATELLRCDLRHAGTMLLQQQVAARHAGHLRCTGRLRVLHPVLERRQRAGHGADQIIEIAAEPVTVVLGRIQVRGYRHR
ncbi:hypothetical protein G6F59_016609 [Rhizopus arrhizus]|nr:hypothetical protein G6F59_016609 [Rhizopus arrhizus]